MNWLQWKCGTFCTKQYDIKVTAQQEQWWLNKYEFWIKLSKLLQGW